MRVISQLVIAAVILAVAIPISARYVPGTRPLLDRIGLMQPLVAAGLVPEDTVGKDRGQPPGSAGSRKVAVVARALERETLREVISAIGSARGVQSVELSFEVTGRLDAIMVAPGKRVAVGDVVAELDAETAQLAVDRAKLVREDAQKTVDRLEQLAKSGTTTELQRQEAELALRTADLGLQSAVRDLANHRLLAPIAGQVGLIGPQVGDLVSPTTSVTRIEDRSSLIVEFRVPERFAARVGVGDAVLATAVSTPGETIEGRIVAVDNRVDEGSRTLRVQASIRNDEDRLRAGMAFQISLAFTGDTYPAVDPLAIQWGADGAFVWIVRDGKASRLPILILQRNSETVLVEAPFEADDMVVTEGVQALRPGSEVAIVVAES